MTDVELFTCDHDFDPNDEGKPVVGIWLARNDGVVMPGDWDTPLPVGYHLIGTAREVTSVTVHDEDCSLLGPSRFTIGETTLRIDIRWVARISPFAWTTVMRHRVARPMVAQWGVDRSPNVHPEFDTFDRLAVRRFGQTTFDGLKTSTRIWPGEDGNAYTMFFDPERPPLSQRHETGK